jgi:hypothetical protein
MRLFQPRKSRKTSAPPSGSRDVEDLALRRKSSVQELTAQAISTSSSPSPKSGSPLSGSLSSSRVGSASGSRKNSMDGLDEAPGVLWFVRDLPSLSDGECGAVIRVGDFCQPKKVYQAKAATADSMAEQSTVFGAAMSVICGESFLAYVSSETTSQLGLLVPNGADHSASLLAVKRRRERGLCWSESHCGLDRQGGFQVG